MTRDKMREKGNILIVLVVIAALAVGVVFYFKSKPPTIPTIPTTSYKSPSATSQPTSTKSAEETKTFRSKTLKFSILIPDTFQVKDDGIRVLISSSEGVVVVSRNGTQFNSLDEYIKDFDVKHKAKARDEKTLSIDHYPSISRIIKYPGSSSIGDKIYFIYITDAVYHISTSSESLFNDLDQIAQSFRYTP